MHDLAIEQVGDRRQADMRMRTDIGLARQARLHQLGPHAVEEDVGADHAALGERQPAADFKGAQVAAALLDDEFDHGKDLRLEWGMRSEEHTSELQSIMRITYAVFCLKKKKHRDTKD